jgi:hypothetical protein
MNIHQHPVILSQAGNTTVEYSMVGGLVLVASLGILILLGDSLNVAVGSVRSDITNKAFGAWFENSMGRVEANNVVTLGNGQIIERPDAGATITEAVQTTGGSGSTLAAAEQLLALTTYLSRVGLLDEEQQASLSDLANQGLRIARMQELIESSYNAAGKDWSVVDHTIVKFEGQEYYVGELAQRIGWEGNDSNSDLPFKLNPEGGQAINAFKELRAKVEQNGSLNHPDIRAFVDQKFTNVVFVSGMVEEGYDTRLPEKKDDTVVEQVEDTYGEALGLGGTDIKEGSGDICTAGGGTVSGGTCK